MRAAETRLAALLEDPGRYVVPHFQRAYSWRRREWATLWDDILELYELGTAQTHFMGSVVLLREGDSGFGETKLVIDGQQRLVTLSLFLAALRDLARDQEPNLAEHIDTTFLQDGADAEAAQPRILCSYGDQDAFASIVEQREQTPLSPVIDAYAEFRSDVSEQLANGLSLARLAEVVLSRLAFVVITLGAADNPYRVFESLYAKGMPLTQGYLLRNYFFMRLPTDEHDEWFRTVWQPMQSRLGEALDRFMHDYLAKDREAVRAEEVYQSWRKRLAQLDVPGVKDVLRDLAAWSTDYDQLLRPGREPGGELKQRLEWLTAWSATLRQPLLPFLLLVHADHRRGNLPEPDSARLLQAVQSFVARRAFTSASDSDETEQLVKLYAGTASDTQRVDAFIEALSQPLLGWPTDDELAAAMLTYPLYPRSHAEQRQLLLIALEQTFSQPMRVRVGDFDLELIAPLLPREDW